VSETTFDARHVEEALGRAWKWLLAAGLVAIAAGIASILLPAWSSIAVATFIGILFLFVSAALLVDGFAVRRSAGRTVLRLLFAVLYAIAGIYLLVAPLEGSITLTLVLGVLFLVEGGLRVGYALVDRMTPARGWQLASGLLTAALGILILVKWPSSSRWVIGTLVGVNLLFWGWNMVALALVGRRVATEPRRAPEPTPA
jgi:uncharacterized membrane protein HdeD (DUF308 family)